MIHRSLILDIIVDLIARTALVFALFLLFTGHNAPGGGFVAGLVVGIAVTLRFVARGKTGVEEVIALPSEALMGAGLALAITTGLLGWVWGETFLDGAKLTLDLPVLGQVKATSALPFDIGVFLVVVGLSTALVVALGEQDPTE